MERCQRVKIQQRFDLCKDPDSVMLPLAYNDKILSKRPIDKLVAPDHLTQQATEADVTRCARQIVVMMPSWLVYAPSNKIIHDVSDVLNSRNDLTIA